MFGHVSVELENIAGGYKVYNKLLKAYVTAIFQKRKTALKEQISISQVKEYL